MAAEGLSMSRHDHPIAEPPLLRSQVLRAVGEVDLYLTLFITSSGGV
jgi:hypothetical protein